MLVKRKAVRREVVKMKKLLIILILLALAIPGHAAAIYKWLDKDGVVNYTDDYSKVPAFYRDRVETLEFFTGKGPPERTPQATPEIKEEIRTDIYGRDETWWREKVRPWKEQLKEATENYERVREEYMKQAEGLGPYNFGKMSLTQYQMLSSRLNILNSEMAKYHAQMDEANEMLEKLSKEAEKTKADPVWLE
jgi:hypothetical protein